MTALTSGQHPPIGVGFVGAGPVVQAIHVPTLRRLPQQFTVSHVFDVDDDLAAKVAAPWGARSSTTIESLLTDPSVEVVAICSPHHFHAEQAIAACHAGKRAVLIEKPFATTVEQAREVATVAAETGTPVFVGAMHQFDPGWVRSGEQRRALTDATLIRSSIVLPPNPVFEDYATEVANRPRAVQSAPIEAAAAIRNSILGLAIHDLPLIREWIPAGAAIEVLSATTLQPGGYLVILRAGDVLVHLHAQSPVAAEPSWTLSVDAPSGRIRTSFTPSYVHAGSAVTRASEGDQTHVFGPYAANGYEGEWNAISDVLAGAARPPLLDELVHDLEFAIAIAEGAAARIALTTEVFA